MDVTAATVSLTEESTPVEVSIAGTASLVNALPEHKFLFVLLEPMICFLKDTPDVFSMPFAAKNFLGTKCAPVNAYCTEFLNRYPGLNISTSILPECSEAVKSDPQP